MTTLILQVIYSTIQQTNCISIYLSPVCWLDVADVQQVLLLKIQRDYLCHRHVNFVAALVLLRHLLLPT